MKNRIIKFRAFVAGKMHYDVSPFAWDYVLDLSMHKCVRSTGNGILGSGGREATFELNGYGSQTDLHLMQFTGLIDKNGKEVFEGDIIERLYRYEVRFKNGYFFGYNKKGCLSVFEIRNDMTVIGNIYENPELLK